MLEIVSKLVSDELNATFDELLSYLITSKSPGDSVVLTVLREGQPIDVTLTLGARP